jgi:hypothetical protein
MAEAAEVVWAAAALAQKGAITAAWQQGLSRCKRMLEARAGDMTVGWQSVLGQAM